MSNEIYEVRQPEFINRAISVQAVVPGSKSITNRALLLAATADGTSTLKGCLASDDAVHFLECLKALGFPVNIASDKELGIDIRITGFGGSIPNKKAEIYVGSAGTAARFLTAMLAFSDGEYTVNSSEQMKKRPMQPLINVLRSTGAVIDCPENEGHFPLHIVGVKDKAAIPDSLTVNIDESSQFLSALLIAAGTLGKRAEIRVTGNHGLSYADMTVKMMKSFGVSAEKRIENGQVRYLFSGEGSYKAIEYRVEPDMSAAAYFYALAAVLGARVAVKGISDNMLQGDAQFLKVLQKMGCTVIRYSGVSDNREETGGGILVTGAQNGRLKGGFTTDMSSFSDQALTLAAIAPFADAPITITGIGHIRVQECDRIKAIVDDLTALGIIVNVNRDEVTIYPGTPKGCVIETYGDHRVAMSFALTGLRTKGLRIADPYCCKKTFAQYFDVLERVISELEKK